VAVSVTAVMWTSVAAAELMSVMMLHSLMALMPLTPPARRRLMSTPDASLMTTDPFV